MPELEVKGITKHFGGVAALNNISFSVGERKVLGIVGPNGAGKTTLFNVISGFMRPDSGKVFLNGEDITKLKPHERVRKGMARTFQFVKVFRHLSVYENLKVAALQKKQLSTNVDGLVANILRLVGLEGKENKETNSLSIGDLKRLELGRALATEPKVLLLDEPFAGLTHMEVVEISGLVYDLVEKGLTVVIVEHVLRELKKFAEDIIVLHFGTKIAEGKFQDVLNKPEVKEAYLGGVSSA